MKKRKNEIMKDNVRENEKSDMPASRNSFSVLCGTGKVCPEEPALKEVCPELFGLDELSSPVEVCLEEPALKEVCSELFGLDELSSPVEACPEEPALMEVCSELFGLDELSSPVEVCLEEPALKEVCPERKCFGDCCLERMEPVEIQSVREKYWLSPDQIERILGLPAGRWRKLEKGEEFPSPLENRMIRAVSWDEFMLEILEICRPIFSPHEFHTLQDLINAHPSFE